MSLPRSLCALHSLISPRFVHVALSRNALRCVRAEHSAALSYPRGTRLARRPVGLVSAISHSSACALLASMTTTLELNPAPSGYHDEDYARTVEWTEPGLTITRLRLLGDSGFGAFDVSYCHGILGDERVRVRLPFSQLPRRGMRQALYRHAKATGRYIDGLFDAVSILA